MSNALSSEEKAQLWSALKETWAVYKKLESLGKERSEFSDLEKEIERIQKALNVFDKPNQFEERWEQKKTHTAEEVKKATTTISESRQKVLVKCAEEAIDEECFISTYILSRVPDLSKNPAKLGQLINQTWDKAREK